MWTRPQQDKNRLGRSFNRLALFDMVLGDYELHILRENELGWHERLPKFKLRCGYRRTETETDTSFSRAEILCVLDGDGLDRDQPVALLEQRF